MKKYLNVYVLLAIVMLLMTSCSGIGYLVGGEDCIGESPILGMYISEGIDSDPVTRRITTFSYFLMGVWIFALLSALFYFLGTCDDTVGGHHIIQVDGKMHHIVNYDEMTVLSGTGSIERGNKWGNNTLSILLHFTIFLLLYTWLCDLFGEGDLKLFLSVSIVYATSIFCLKLYPFPYISLIKKCIWMIVAFDFMLGFILWWFV